MKSSFTDFLLCGGVLSLIVALAWLIQRRMAAPVADADFHLPDTDPITPRLVGGSALFGIGWGLGGLCPGPALAAFAINPPAAAVFTAAMAVGFAIVWALDRPSGPRTPVHA